MEKQSITDRVPGDFPKLDDLKPGDKLVADGGFTCLYEGEVVTVQKDGSGELFVMCAGEKPGQDYGKPQTTKRTGQHGLDGQCGENGECVGLFRKLK